MKVYLLDDRELEVQANENGEDIAKKISSSLAKQAIAYKLDGEIYDLKRPIEHEGHFEIIKKGDEESYDVLNHSTSHLMAEAISHLYPNAKFGFGPSIEEGFYYDVDFGDEKITDADFPKIEKEMKKIASSGKEIVREVVSKEEAKKLFANNPYKLELIDGIDGEITIYRQGDFYDLCAGPHVEKVSQIQHFKLLSVAGAYWRGNVNNKMLTRIYGTSFFTEEELQNHLHDLEERKKRDHRKIGKELGLFMMSEYGPGLPFFLPNGYAIKRELENYWIDFHRKHGYLVCETPMMLSKELWEISGHWDHYKDDMYITMVDDTPYAIKPMNCPGAILIYNNSLHSYKDLPVRIAELGHVHRHEASGALNGLFRVRTFTQDDAHILLREDQIGEEITNIIKVYDHIYSLFHLNYHIELSTRPEDNFIGDIAVWDKAEADLIAACKATGREFKINPGDGAFYGPKLDFKLRDSMNRIWQCGTIQLDMQLPGRFNCFYIDKDGNKVTPVMIHRACFGSLERFIAIITENFAGAFPTWLAPVQVKILPVASVHNEYAEKLNEQFMDLHLRSEVDEREEKLGYRMREAQTHKIPYTLVIGDNEVKDHTVTYRKYGSKEQITVSVDEFVKLIKDEIEKKTLLTEK